MYFQNFGHNSIGEFVTIYFNLEGIIIVMIIIIISPLKSVRHRPLVAVLDI
jgi:hypothetical protein